MPQYNVNTLTVSNLLSYIKDKSIAIPEIQRPFVWGGDKIRDLIDSLYNGFPVGYLIIWQNPDTIDKNGEKTIGKRIMIDGQQRITALMTSIVGLKVLDKDFNEKVHKIAFNPYAANNGEPCFEVQSAAIARDKKWISDISVLFSDDFNSYEFIPNFCAENPDFEPKRLNLLIEKVRDIKNAPIGVIYLDKDLPIDKVTEIFIRINSTGAALTQADFVMSTLAADDTHGGTFLRKAVDYFCHLLSSSNFMLAVERDTEFISSEYFPMIEWASKADNTLFSMSFDDVLRIAFMSQYTRAKMVNLTDMLHGRNFETRKYEEEKVHESFDKFTVGLKDVFNKYSYNQFNECLKGAGFINRRLIKGRMSIDFAYVLFLRLKREGMDSVSVARYVQKWYVMSVLTGRYVSSPESVMEADLRGIREKRFLTYYHDVMANLSDTFWDVTLVQKLETSASNAPVFNVFLASQCKNTNASFLSIGYKVRDLLDTAEIHHIFPRQYLKDNKMDTTTVYNQIANYAYLSKPINAAIGKKSPKEYLGEVVNAINTCTASKYSTITSMDEFRNNLAENCIPQNTIDMESGDYLDFLTERRKMMAKRIRDYFNSL